MKKRTKKKSEKIPQDSLPSLPNPYAPSYKELLDKYYGEFKEIPVTVDSLHEGLQAAIPGAVKVAIHEAPELGSYHVAVTYSDGRGGYAKIPPQDLFIGLQPLISSVLKQLEAPPAPAPVTPEPDQPQDVFWLLLAENLNLTPRKPEREAQLEFKELDEAPKTDPGPPSPFEDWGAKRAALIAELREAERQYDGVKIERLHKQLKAIEDLEYKEKHKKLMDLAIEAMKYGQPGPDRPFIPLKDPGDAKTSEKPARGRIIEELSKAIPWTFITLKLNNGKTQQFRCRVGTLAEYWQMAENPQKELSAISAVPGGIVADRTFQKTSWLPDLKGTFKLKRKEEDGAWTHALYTQI